MLRYLTSGESHGQSLITIIDGIPSNIELNIDEINEELKTPRWIWPWWKNEN